MESFNKITIAALKLFQEKGIKLTMDDIAKATGMSKRTIYEKVESKEKLIENIINDTFKEIKEKQDIIYNSNNKDIVSKLKELLTVKTIYQELIDFRRISEIEVYSLKLFNKIKKNISEGWDLTIDLLEKGIAEGVFKKTNVPLIVEIFKTSMRGILEGDFLIKSNISHKEAIENIVDIVFEGIIKDN